MNYLIYISSAIKVFNNDELETLLEKAITKNKRLGITGMLAYRGGNFIQHLEGEEKELDHLYCDIICNDPRHKDLTILKQGKLEERVFEQWSMDWRTIENKSIFTGAELKNDHHGVKSILENFVKNMS